MEYIPTITRSFTKPVLSSAPPAEWCNHNCVKYMCAYCSKFKYEGVKDLSGNPASVTTVQMSETAPAKTCESNTVASVIDRLRNIKVSNGESLK